MSTSGCRGTKFPKAIEYIENKGGVRDPEKPFLMMIGMNPPHSPHASTDDCGPAMV